MTNFRKGNHGFRSESKERDHHYYYICSAFWRPYQSKLHNGCILFWSSILTNEWLLTILYFLLLFRFHIFGSHKNLAQEEMQIHNQKRLRITKASHVYPSWSDPRFHSQVLWVFFSENFYPVFIPSIEPIIFWPSFHSSS